MRASNLVTAVALTLLPVAALAADSDAELHLRDQLHTTTVALRAAQDENADLAAKQTEQASEIASLKQQLADAQAKSAVTGSADQQRRDAADAAIRQNQQLSDKVAEASQLLEKWQTAYKQAADVAHARDAAAKDFEIKFTRASGGLTQCGAKNAALEKLSREILDRLDQRGLLSDFAADEPVTQLYRVKLENLIQDYQDKIRDQEMIQ